MALLELYERLEQTGLTHEEARDLLFNALLDLLENNDDHPA